MNAESLNFPDAKFDRIIATCLVVHLKNIEKALLEWRRVLKPNGVITMYIALEPSIMLRLFWNLIKIKGKKTKIYWL
jgi:ubiquinone/menaquinone biosynthesis C-methylase UbiE